MARFAINEPIVTGEPTIVVDAGLPVGRHRFRLEVVDTAGQVSRPDEAIVEVQRIVTPPVPPVVVEPVPRPPIGPTPPIGPRPPVTPTPIGPRPIVDPTPIRPVPIGPRRPRRRSEP
jgi:hypothetical protein